MGIALSMKGDWPAAVAMWRATLAHRPTYHHIHQHIFEGDPFASLDRAGVGRLMQIARDEGRRARPGIKIGICGEHGGDPRSIEFCHILGLDYVSCSPYRLPIARLAAAQAALEFPRER